MLRSKKFGLITIGFVGLVLLSVLALLLITGRRLYLVATPSMGQTLPVGTLVISQPANDYQVDDIITFRQANRTVTHRVVAVNEDGYVTRGDLNPFSDPLPVKKSDIIGKKQWSVWGAGWLIRALPVFLIGSLIIYLLTRTKKINDYWRWSLRISGMAILAVLIVANLRPLFRFESLGFTAGTESGVDIRVVNTGLLPIELKGTRLVDGQDAVIHTEDVDEKGRFRLTPHLSLNWWQFSILALVCLSPMLLALLVRFEREDKLEDKAKPDDELHNTKRLVWGWKLAAFSTLVAFVIVSLLWSSTHASLIARVQNTNDTAGSRTYFNCKGAESTTTNRFLAWAMGSATATETDITGNTRTGTYTPGIPTLTATNDVGCKRDTPKNAVNFDGASTCLYPPASSAQNVVNDFTLEAWFKTNQAGAGKIIGLGTSQTTAYDGAYDRHLIIDTDGRIFFGVYPGGVSKIYSTNPVNDNVWHHAIATLSSTSGMALYIDGVLVSTNPSTTWGYTYPATTPGYWKVGCGNTSGWSNSLLYFKGQIQYAAVYYTALNSTQVLEHYKAGQ